MQLIPGVRQGKRASVSPALTWPLMFLHPIKRKNMKNIEANFRLTPWLMASALSITLVA
jgi:hypothetical protein